ncbi:ketopantoate reductase family protein [Thermodesulfobacteriota bacterium]
MRIAVIGLGGVGGYYGGKLAKFYQEHDFMEIIFIARGKHLEKIKEKGLKLITSDEGEFIAKPHIAIEDPSSSGLFDIILFCTKSYDLEESAKLIKKNIGEDTVAVSLLNGVDNPGKISSAYPDLTVLNGCVYVSAFIEEPGIVRQPSGPGLLFFGDEKGEFKDWQGIEMVFKDAGIKCQYREDIKNVVWEKYIFICPLASVTSFTGKSFGEVIDNRESQNLLEGLLHELCSIAESQGIALPANFQKTLFEKIKSFPRDTKSSMQLDFERRNKTEIETFTGYVVKHAKKNQIEVPLHQMVYSELSKRKIG